MYGWMAWALNAVSALFNYFLRLTWVLTRVDREPIHGKIILRGPLVLQMF
jgi:hypothetical protein